MKITLAILAVFAVLLTVLTGCTPPIIGTAPQPAPTVAQFMSQVCPPGQETIATLQAMGSEIPQNVQDKLSEISPVVNKACAVGASVSIASVKDFAKTTIPGLISLVESSNMSKDKKEKFTAALLITQVAIASAR